MPVQCRRIRCLDRLTGSNMEPVTTSLLAAGAAGIGEGLISSAFNAWQANKQQNFQERMSNTAHQREVADLRKAGLNPILSARLGGSSSPPGSSAQAAHTNVTGNAIQAARTAAEMRVMDSTANQQNSAASLSQAQTKDINLTQQNRIDNLIAENLNILSRTGLTDTQKKEVLQQIQNLKSQKKLVEQQTESSAFDSSKKEVQSKLWEIPGKAMDKIPNWWERTKENWKKGKQQYRNKQRGATGGW